MVRLSNVELKGGELVETRAIDIPQRWLVLHPTCMMLPSYWMAIVDDMAAHGIDPAQASDADVLAAIERVLWDFGDDEEGDDNG
jgi:hypothetical protein